MYNFYRKYCQKTIYAHSPPLMLGTVLDSCKILGRSMHNFFVLKKKSISVVDLWVNVARKWGMNIRVLPTVTGNEWLLISVIAMFKPNEIVSLVPQLLQSYSIRLSFVQSKAGGNVRDSWNWNPVVFIPLFIIWLGARFASIILYMRLRPLLHHLLYAIASFLLE